MLHSKFVMLVAKFLSHTESLAQILNHFFPNFPSSCHTCSSSLPPAKINTKNFRGLKRKPFKFRDFYENISKCGKAPHPINVRKECPLNPRAPSSKMGRRKKTASISTSPELKSCLDSNSNSNSNSVSISDSDSGEAKSKSSIEQLTSQIHELQISHSHLHNLIAVETLPVFQGRAGKENAVDWLTATERHFAYLGVPAADRVKLAATRLRGDASPWMCWYESRFPATAPWSNFRHEFLRFFRPETLIAAVCNLEQKKRLVKEYEVDFLRVAAGAGEPSPEWSDEELMRHFVGGLKEEIRRKVEWFRPKTLADAMDFARNVEAESV